MRASQKLAMSPDDALRIVQAFALSWPTLDLTPAIVFEAGRGVVSTHWHTMMHRSGRRAPQSDRRYLSEDFNPGSILEGVRFVDPFDTEFGDRGMDVNNRTIQGVALTQTRAYADASGAGEAHLVIFDRTPGKPWAEKVWRRTESYRGLDISVWGC
ncbi:MAG: hypothetical protein H6639_17025 [Caldilineaceae bacterium]|nr:hypothetical protein [Caldilineaceae bacterium]